MLRNLPGQDYGTTPFGPYPDMAALPANLTLAQVNAKAQRQEQIQSDFCLGEHTNGVHTIHDTNLHTHGVQVRPGRNPDGTHSDNIILRLIDQKDLAVREAQATSPTCQWLRDAINFTPASRTEVAAGKQQLYHLAFDGITLVEGAGDDASHTIADLAAQNAGTENPLDRELTGNPAGRFRGMLRGRGERDLPAARPGRRLAPGAAIRRHQPRHRPEVPGLRTRQPAGVKSRDLERRPGRCARCAWDLPAGFEPSTCPPAGPGGYRPGCAEQAEPSCDRLSPARNALCALCGSVAWGKLHHAQLATRSMPVWSAITSSSASPRPGAQRLACYGQNGKWRGAVCLSIRPRSQRACRAVRTWPAAPGSMHCRSRSINLRVRVSRRRCTVKLRDAGFDMGYETGCRTG